MESFLQMGGVSL